MKMASPTAKNNHDGSYHITSQQYCSKKKRKGFAYIFVSHSFHVGFQIFKTTRWVIQHIS
jgi:hypothetical protein